VEIDEDVDQGVVVGNGLAVAEFGTFDSEGFGLGIDRFAGGTLDIELLAGIRVAIKLVAKATTLVDQFLWSIGQG